MKRPAECVARQGPAQRVDDAIEGLPDLPDLLHAQREDLRDWVTTTFCHARHAWPSVPRVPSVSTVTLAVRSAGSM